MVHHWSSLAISVYAIARLLPQPMEFSQQKHLYESLQGFGMGIFFLFAPLFFFFQHLYNIQRGHFTRGFARGLAEAQAISALCAYETTEINVEVLLHPVLLAGRYSDSPGPLTQRLLVPNLNVPSWRCAEKPVGLRRRAISHGGGARSDGSQRPVLVSCSCTAAIADLVFVDIPDPCGIIDPAFFSSFFCRSPRRCNAILTLPKQMFYIGQ